MRQADAHRLRTFLLVERRRYDLAEAAARAWLAAAPRDPRAHGLLAICLAERGRQTEAVAEADQAIGLAPDQALGHYVRAHALLQLHRYSSAARSIEEAIRLDPDDAGCHNLLAAVRIGQRRWTDALAAAERALALDPEHAGATSLRALALRRTGRTYQAWEATNSALSRDPEDVLAHASAGWARLDAGDAEHALPHFRDALRIDPRSRWAREGLVLALRQRRWASMLLLLAAVWARRLTRRQKLGLAAGAGLASATGLAAVAHGSPLLPVAALAAPIAAGVAVLLAAERLFDAFADAAIRDADLGLVDPEPGGEASTWVDVSLIAALAIGIPGLARGQPPAIAAGAAALALFLSLRATVRCLDRGVRRAMGAYTAATGLLGLALVSLAAMRWPAGGPVPPEVAWLGSAIAIPALLAAPVARRLAARARRRGPPARDGGGPPCPV